MYSKVIVIYIYIYYFSCSFPLCYQLKKKYNPEVESYIIFCLFRDVIFSGLFKVELIYQVVIISAVGRPSEDFSLAKPLSGIPGSST